MVRLDKIAVLMRPNNEPSQQVFSQLISFLLEQDKQIFLDPENQCLSLAQKKAQAMSRSTQIHAYPIKDWPSLAELVLIIGGDGTFLRASQFLSANDIPALGINTGRVGFLADIEPSNLENELNQIFAGKFVVEERFLLEIYQQSTPEKRYYALNEVVLHTEKMVQIVELVLYVNDELAIHQRCDGLIIATPTGTTAYALSAGGPIIHPDVPAIALVPLYPQTLSARPMIVPETSVLKLGAANNNKGALFFSCDGQLHTHLESGDWLIIQKSARKIQLIRPIGQNFFENCRNKIGWDSAL